MDGGPLLGSFNDLLRPNLKKYRAPSLDMTLLHHCADSGTNMIYHGGRSVFSVIKTGNTKICYLFTNTLKKKPLLNDVASLSFSSQ